MKHIPIFQDFAAKMSEAKKVMINKDDSDEWRVAWGVGSNLDLGMGSSSTPKLKPHELLLSEAITAFMKKYHHFTAQVTVQKNPSRKNLIGDITLTETSVKKHRFRVNYNPDQSYTHIIKSLLHELTHVKQVVKGELLPNAEYTALLWQGKEFISIQEYNKILKNIKNQHLVYRNLPWEQEAETAAHDLYEVFLSSPEWASLRGRDTTLDFIMDNI
jgi:hypothetical protein